MIDIKQTKSEWKKEFRAKMSAYTDGKGEFSIKGEKAGIKGFWLRCGMDGEIDEKLLEKYIESLLSQQREQILGEERKRVDKILTSFIIEDEFYGKGMAEIQTEVIVNAIKIALKYRKEI